MASLKASRLISEFQELQYFNQSDSKCWKTLKKIEHDSTQSDSHNKIIKVKDTNGLHLDSNEKISNAFGENLEKIFNCHVPVKHSAHSIDLPKDLESALITKDEFFKALKKIKPKAAPGLDMVNNRVIKNLPIRFLKRIFNLFNESIRLGHIPPGFKLSKIVMVHKKGKPPDELDSFRPISLISCLAKLQEKIINQKLKRWIESNALLPNCQSGFREKMSTQDHIL